LRTLKLLGNALNHFSGHLPGKPGPGPDCTGQVAHRLGLGTGPNFDKRKRAGPGLKFSRLGWAAYCQPTQACIIEI